MEYRYGMRQRGFSIGCQPKQGLIRREDSTDKKYWDIIVYDRKLTKQECETYALDDLQEVELPEVLKDICEETGTSKTGIKTLINYYTQNCGWTEESAIEYIYELFENGTIDQIKLIGADGEVI